MGNQCHNMSQSQQYQLIEQFIHPNFGKIFHLRSEKQNKDVGIVKLQFWTERQMNQHVHKIQLAQQYTNIPTLVKINSFQYVKERVNNSQNKKAQLENQKHPIRDSFKSKISFSGEDLSCTNSQASILMNFNYFPPEKSFDYKFNKSQKQISDFLNKKINKNIAQQVASIKLCDYKKIDKLPFNQRRYMNFYYQELQILRMIDQITGALFVLMHFNIKHGGVRPQMTVFDDDGKIVLIDRQIFGRPTNYELSINKFNEYKNNQKSVKIQQIVQYLSPQLLNDLSNLKNIAINNQTTQKGNIFSLGLMMIQCCLMEKVKIYDCVLHSNVDKNEDKNKQQIEFKLNKQNLIKSLSEVKKKYSQKLVQLLRKMTQIQPQKRISYSELIEQLNFLMNKNLQNLREVYADYQNNQQQWPQQQQDEDIVFSLNQNNQKSQGKIKQKGKGKTLISHKKNVICAQLAQKLKKIDYNIQKVLGKKQLFNDKINIQALQKDQKRIIKQLERVSKLAQSKNSMQTFTSFDDHLKSLNRNVSTLQNSYEISKNHSVDLNFTQKFNRSPSTIAKRLNSSAKIKKNKMQQSMKRQELIGQSIITQSIPLTKQIKTLNKPGVNTNVRQLKGNQLYDLYLKEYNNIKLSRPNIKP